MLDVFTTSKTIRGDLRQSENPLMGGDHPVIVVPKTTTTGFSDDDESLTRRGRLHPPARSNQFVDWFATFENVARPAGGVGERERGVDTQMPIHYA